MSAKLDVKVIAKNDKNEIVKNFDSASWENGVTLDFQVSTPNMPTILKDAITSKKIGFSSGEKHIAYTETNSSRNLMFNFHRDVNKSLNPVVVSGSDIDLNISSTYSVGGSSETIKEKTTPSVSENVTFVYGRTHATRQRYEGNSGDVSIYYETYCYNTDSDGVSCNKSLLPDGTTSRNSDDIRWFINYQHIAPSSGEAGNINEKDVTQVTSTTPDSNNPSKATLTYSEKYGYSYKTTMENNASNWLIYNRDNPSATKNRFSVEFTKAGVGWNGAHETNATTKDASTTIINRRSQW
jgi:hypothetical protein